MTGTLAHVTFFLKINTKKDQRCQPRHESKRCKIKNSGGKKRLAQAGEEENENFRRSGTELQTSSASGLIKISAAAAQVKWLLIFDFFFFFS